MAHTLENKERTKDVLLEDSISFSSMLLSQNVFKGLEAGGFVKPSPIQLKAIPVGRCGFDLVVKSKSGTGKTLVFSVLALESINVSKNKAQVLILAPTREIAVQIQDVLRTLGQFVEGLKVECFIGGMPLDTDIENCKGCHIAVGAPGRIKHLITSGHLNTSSIRLFVLDEADKLMESSFQNDINEIYNSLPDRKQMVTTSATYPNQLDDFLSNYMLSPTHITAEVQSPLLLGLKQFALPIKSCSAVALQMKTKNEILLKLLSYISFTQCLIFSNYQTRAESISNYLNQKGWNSMYISAAQTQALRLEVINNLKDLKCRILISTDLTARGIDAANVDLVVNYDVPNDAVTYLHRMGRAGRYGSKGILVNMVFEGNEMSQLQNVLGAIGGSNLAIPVLTDLEDQGVDLLNLDTTDLKYVQGKLASDKGLDNLSTQIKTKVLDLKDFSQDLNANKSVNGEVDSEDSLVTDTEGKNGIEVDSIDTKTLLERMAAGVMNIEETVPEKENNSIDVMSIINESKGIKSTTSNESLINPTLLLEAMKSGNEISKQANKVTNDIDTKAILKSLAEGKLNIAALNDNRDSMQPTGDDNKKRKRKDHSKANLNIIDKNRALLNISMVLDDNKKDLGGEGISSVEKFLTLLKTEDSNNSDVVSKTVETAEKELLSEHNDATSTVTKNETFENIFKIGYEYAINPNAKHWRELLPESEIKSRLENLHLHEKGEESDDEEDADDDDYQTGEDEDMSESISQDIEEGDRPKKIPKTVKDLEHDPDWAFMKWIPVKKSERIFTNKAKSQNLLYQASDMDEEADCDEDDCEEENDQCVEEYQQSQNVDYYATEDTNYQYMPYCSHLNQCSDNLWNNGLDFDTAQDFEHWFDNEWQQEVASVRNYIQQNIYIQEMSKYQQSCLNNYKH